MRVRRLNGYRVVFAPEHPNAMKSENWAGFVYEHILVASEMLGRPLRRGEIVHHKDGNRSHNTPGNLEVTTRSKHGRKHAEELYGPLPDCAQCGKPMSRQRVTYCSVACVALGYRRVERPSRDELLRLLETNSFLAVGRKFGVSDNAIRKWLR